MTTITAEHVQAHTITEYEHFPEHNERKETLEFRNAKHELENVEHLGCYVCGSMDKRESHHIFERSLWNGLDVRQVAMYLYEHFDFHGHCHRDFTSADDLYDWFMAHFNGRIETYVDPETGESSEVHVCDDVAADSLYVQWILCETHHRASGTGIHATTTPSFFGWLARRPGFDPTFNAADAKAYAARLKRGETH